VAVFACAAWAFSAAAARADTGDVGAAATLTPALAVDPGTAGGATWTSPRAHVAGVVAGAVQPVARQLLTATAPVAKHVRGVVQVVRTVVGEERPAVPPVAPPATVITAPRRADAAPRPPVPGAVKTAAQPAGRAVPLVGPPRVRRMAGGTAPVVLVVPRWTGRLIVAPLRPGTGGAPGANGGVARSVALAILGGRWTERALTMAGLAVTGHAAPSDRSSTPETSPG
jgi:hypothetical protein